VRQLVPLLEVPVHRPWCTGRFARRLVQERRIPFHKVGGKILVDLDDLDELAERGRIEPPRRLRTIPGRSTG
jgi:excisionase family DNA binding protein